MHLHELFNEVLALGKLQGGYTRYLAHASGLQFGVGGHVSASVVPEVIKPQYGRRVNPGVQVRGSRA